MSCSLKISFINWIQAWNHWEFSEVSWSTCARLSPKHCSQLPSAEHFTWTLKIYRIKPQTYQECSIIPHQLWYSDIKNTIIIFHHLWQASESTDKPRLHYYFRFGKQFNIFYSSEFICHDTLGCILTPVKTVPELKQSKCYSITCDASCVKSTTVPKRTLHDKSQCYFCHNDLFKKISFLSKCVCHAVYSEIEKVESPLICVM